MKLLTILLLCTSFIACSQTTYTNSSFNPEMENVFKKNSERLKANFFNDQQNQDDNEILKPKQDRLDQE